MTPEPFASQVAAWVQYPLVMIMVGTLFFTVWPTRGRRDDNPFERFISKAIERSSRSS